MLGQELVRAFEGADVLAWDREDIDITDAAAVRARVSAARPDVLINAVAFNAVDAVEQDPRPAERVNGEAVGFLAAVAADLGVTFVHYSTDYVFDGSCREGYAEDAVPNPISAYGRTKWMGEEALLAVASTHPAWTWYLIRTSRLFGPPASSADAKRSFVDTMVALSRTKDQLEVVDDEVSSPTSAVDLAGATREIVDRALPSGTYHRTNDGSCTWYSFAAEIFHVIGWSGTLVPVPASTYPRPAKRPACSVLRTTKLPPMRRWEKALVDDLSTAAIFERSARGGEGQTS